MCSREKSLSTIFNKMTFSKSQFFFQKSPTSHSFYKDTYELPRRLVIVEQKVLEKLLIHIARVS